MKRILLAIFLTVVVSACGFEPMYGNGVGGRNENIQSALAQIDIANIPDREGQYLRNLLIDRFYRNGRPATHSYLLTVAPIQEGTVDLDITKSSDATRAQLQLKTAMTLKDLNSGEVVLTRKLHAVSSYNVLTSEFATRVSEQNTRENALNELARQIELQIGLHLRR